VFFIEHYLRFFVALRLAGFFVAGLRLATFFFAAGLRLATFFFAAGFFVAGFFVARFFAGILAPPLF